MPKRKKSDGLMVRIQGAIFNVPHFITHRKKRYAENTTHSFASHALKKAKAMEKKGWSVIIKKQSSINRSGKTITAFTTYIKRKVKR